MEEEDNRNMAAQGGKYLHEIQSEGMSYRTTVWRRCIVQRWSAIEFRWTQRERVVAEQWTESEVWIDRWDSRQETGNDISSYTTVVPGREEEEEGRSKAGRWGLHPSSINTIVLCLREAKLNLFSSESRSLLDFLTVMHHCQHCQVLSRSSRYTHKSMDWFIKTIQEKYWVRQD